MTRREPRWWSWQVGFEIADITVPASRFRTTSAIPSPNPCRTRSSMIIFKLQIRLPPMIITRAMIM